MNEHSLNTLEDRLEKPGYLLLLVVLLLFGIISFVNLIDYTSSDPVLFGRYSLPYFAVLVVTAVAILSGALLLRKPNNDGWLVKSLDTVQKRPLLGIVFFVIFAVIIRHMFRNENWLYFPAVQVSVFVVMILIGGLILFYDWGHPAKPMLWRKATAGLLGVAILIEVVLQGATLLGLTPGLTQPRNSFVPYDRVYQTSEGYANGFANNHGWYYPDFVLADGSKRIVLLGDSFIQAIQVEPEENLGVQLQQQLADENTEVLSLGYPDYGPGLYLDTIMLDYAVDAYEPEEIIVFFDFRNDFQVVQRPQKGHLYFEQSEDGKVEIHPDSFGLRHIYQHQTIRVYEGFEPVRLINSHYLTARFLESLTQTPVASANNGRADNTLGLPNAFVFNEDSNEDAMIVATGLLQIAHEHLAACGVTLKVVTIPVFNDAFYAQGDTADWQTAFGDADLLLPERQFRAFAEAEGIPFLAMGDYLAAQGLTAADIQALFFRNGRGHFTPQGHDTFAAAVYNCFYSQTVSSDAGCDAE